MADYAIHDTTLEGISNTIRKKDGTQALIDPADYADRINLMGMLEEKTQASASVCAFDDGADDVPTRSLVVTIPATLEGVSSVTETKIGKNLLDTANAETKSNHSVNVTCDGKGNYTATGTATGGSANITFTLKTPCEIKSGMYLHLMNSPANANASVTFQKQDNTSIYAPALSPANRIVDLSSYVGQVIYSIRLYVVNNASVDLTFSPMLCYSNTATTFEPYTAPTQYTALLGRTIYGGTAYIVSGQGIDNGKKIKLNTLAWIYNDTEYSYGYFDAQYNETEMTTNMSFVCTGYINNQNPRSQLADGEIGVYNKGNAIRRFVIRDDACTTLQQFLTKIADYDLVYESTTDTPFTFTGQEVPTRIGYNAFWSDEGDTEVTYRSSGTITPVPVVPTLITKTITENGTYDAEDDDADGYSSVTVNVNSVPSGDHDDPYGSYGSPAFGMSMIYSCYFIDDGVLKPEIVMEMKSISGYEGICLNLSEFGLESGKTYTVTLTLDLPSITFSTGYPFGIKYSETRVPTSGNPSTSTYNIQPTESFAYQTGKQTISMQFEAHSTNYLLILLSCAQNNQTALLKIKDIRFEEVTT